LFRRTRASRRGAHFHARTFREARRVLCVDELRGICCRFTGANRATGTGWSASCKTRFLAVDRAGNDGEYFYDSDYQGRGEEGLYKKEVAVLSGTLCRVSRLAGSVYFHGR